MWIFVFFYFIHRKAVDMWITFCTCKLSSVDVSDDNVNYCSQDGVLFNKEKTQIIRYPQRRQGEYIVPEGVSFCDSKVCSAILCNYQDLKFGSEGAFDRDLYYVMHDFDNLLDDALKDYPLYQRITEYKI